MLPLRVFLLILFFAVTSTSSAQVQLPPAFTQALQQGQVEFFSPVEKNFKSLRVRPNSLWPYDMAMRSRKHKLEMRYRVIPNLGLPSKIPHINCLSMASSLATNDQDQQIAVHKITPQQLSEEYNAEWGATVFFCPKKTFSKRRYCKMLALYATNKATIYVFYLFDNPDAIVEQPALIRFES